MTAIAYSRFRQRIGEVVEDAIRNGQLLDRAID
jgi:hypothetical protein